MAILTAAILAILGIAMLKESFSSLAVSLGADEQKIWEHSHLCKKGYVKRRKQLLIQVWIMAGLAVAFLASAIACWSQFSEVNAYDSPGHDKFGEILFGSGALLMATLACGIRIGILAAKLSAIRELSDNTKYQ